MTDPESIECLVLPSDRHDRVERIWVLEIDADRVGGADSRVELHQGRDVSVEPVPLNIGDPAAWESALPAVVIEDNLPISR